MEKESLNDYNPKDGLKEVYHGALPCQSSIYASCTIPEQKGVRPARILLSPLLKNFNVYSCANAPKVDVLEKMFAYMPQGCQIISIDVFQAEETPLEIITGITWAASPVENESETFVFNIYESSLDYEIMNCIDSIELDFVPYQLTHTTYNSNQDPCFVLSGSDQKIHIFCCSQEQTFAEVEADDIFPELLKELPSVALSIAFKCHDSKRYTAIGLECGTFITFIVDLESNEVVEKLTFSFEGPLTKVIFFPTEDQIKVLVLSSLSMTRVFYDLELEGLSKSKVLPSSDEFDVATCCTLADIDFDGHQEILIGTYGELVLVYKEDNINEKWTLQWSKSFNNPIHNIFHLDLTGDGVRDLFLVTLKTVIILQHDYDKVAQLVEKRLLTDAI